MTQRVTPDGNEGMHTSKMGGSLSSLQAFWCQSPCCRPHQAASEESTGRKESLFSRFPRFLLFLLCMTVFHWEEIAKPIEALQACLSRLPASPSRLTPWLDPDCSPAAWRESVSWTQTAQPMELLAVCPFGGTVLLISCLHQSPSFLL